MVVEFFAEFKGAICTLRKESSSVSIVAVFTYCLALLGLSIKLGEKSLSDRWALSDLSGRISQSIVRNPAGFGGEGRAVDPCLNPCGP